MQELFTVKCKPEKILVTVGHSWSWQEAFTQETADTRFLKALSYSIKFEHYLVMAFCMSMYCLQIFRLNHSAEDCKREIIMKMNCILSCTCFL